MINICCFDDFLFILHLILANHNKDYSVVKTFRVGRLALFSFLIYYYRANIYNNERCGSRRIFQTII